MTSWKRAGRVIIVVLAAIGAACGGPPPTKINRLYQGLADPLPRIDPSVLEGRRIVVDPGHGGHFRGTVGQDSLEESRVNLGVALYLWGLLHEAGADVWLTRSMDRDFLAAEDSALATDLQARVDMSDTLQPDVFVSIHHNAQPQRDRDYNRVETYYKAGDPASLDLAFAVHRHLMRNLGIDSGEVRQGNYFVLRNNQAAAVLGESSYLTHPPVEERLRLSDALRLEAEAYFLGILDYFSRGLPRILRFHVETAQKVPLLIYHLEDDGGVGIDPDGISLEVDGRDVIPVLGENNRALYYQFPWDAANREYDVALSVRNLLGNTSPVHHDTVLVDLPVEHAVFDNVAAQPGGLARVRARLLDARGIPVREGTPVAVATSFGDSTDTRVLDGRVDAPFLLPEGISTKEVGVTMATGGRTFTSTIDVLPVREPSTASAPELRPVRIADARDASPVLDAAIATREGYIMASGSFDGVYYRPYELDEWLVVSAPGYVPLEMGGDSVLADTLLLQPWFGGALFDKRFVLDPEGGRARDIGMGPLGLSASQVNLRVANYLAGFLRAAGAEVLLTRTTEEVRTPEDIARMTNRWGANRYIEIRHRAEPADSELSIKTFHFPGSRNGKRMAQDVARVMERRLGVPARPASDLVTYPLQQTACPAIVVEAPSISKVEEELRLDDPWYLREQAYAIFLAVIEHFSIPTPTVVEINAPNDDGWLLQLGGTWNLLAGPGGRAVFEFIEPGQYQVSAIRGGTSLDGVVTVDADTASTEWTTPPPPPRR